MSDRELTRDDVQEMIELTAEQQKTFNALTKAVNQCKKEEIYFYMVLDTLSALNGKNVATVSDHLDYADPRNLQFLKYPSVRITDGWADDTHFVILKEGGE